MIQRLSRGHTVQVLRAHRELLSMALLSGSPVKVISEGESLALKRRRGGKQCWPYK